jgi:hypothetical protein
VKKFGHGALVCAFELTSNQMVIYIKAAVQPIQKRLVESCQRIIAEGFVEEFYAPVLRAEVNFLKSLSPASFRALLAVDDAEHAAYLQSSEKERVHVGAATRRACRRRHVRLSAPNCALTCSIFTSSAFLAASSPARSASSFTSSARGRMGSYWRAHRLWLAGRKTRL